MKNQIIQNDIMRYKKNSLAGNLSLLGLVFGCLYFMVMYAQTCGDIKQLYANGGYVYSVLVGISVILNLVLLLAIFLASEEIKGYSKKFCIVVWVIAGLQILRIFGYPLTNLTQELNSFSGGKVITVGTFIVLLLFLLLSAASLIASGVLGYINANRLEKFKAQIENGEVDLDGALAETEESAVPTESATEQPADSKEVQ